MHKMKMKIAVKHSLVFLRGYYYTRMSTKLRETAWKMLPVLVPLCGRSADGEGRVVIGANHNIS